MTHKAKWDCLVLICSIIGIVNFMAGGGSGLWSERIIGGICLVGIIIGVCKRYGLSWGVFGK